MFIFIIAGIHSSLEKGLKLLYQWKSLNLSNCVSYGFTRIGKTPDRQEHPGPEFVIHEKDSDREGEGGSYSPTFCKS